MQIVPNIVLPIAFVIFALVLFLIFQPYIATQLPIRESQRESSRLEKFLAKNVPSKQKFRF